MNPDRPQHGWQLIAPGVYADPDDGAMHIYPGELLAAAGYADTPENRAMIEKAMREKYPSLPITHT